MIKKRQIFILILVLLLFLHFVAYQVISQTNSTGQETQSSTSFLDVFKYTFLVLALFFMFLFYTRIRRKTLLKQHNISIQQTRTVSYLNKENQKQYTCSNCKQKGTTDDFPWFRSKETGIILCENCYQEKTKPLKNEA